MGEYAVASKLLSLLLSCECVTNDNSGAAGRALVRDYIRLGEMRWRYRIVDEGKNVREEAIGVLLKAMVLLDELETQFTDAHKSGRAALMRRSHAHSVSVATQLSKLNDFGAPLSLSPPDMLMAGGAARIGGAASGAGNGAETGDLTVATYTRASLGTRVRNLDSDLRLARSDVLQGLAVTRLIHNRDRNEDTIIAHLLLEALQLREEAQDMAKIADTLHGIGTLKLKQDALHEAETVFVRALDLRQGLRGDGQQLCRLKAQALAQSHTTIGNLYIAMADQHGLTMALGNAQSASELFSQAVSHLERAREAYIRGFHEKHVKVAWALEGLALAQRKRGKYEDALRWYEQAVIIRSAHHGGTNFTAELQACVMAVDEMRAKLGRGPVREPGAGHA